MVVRICMGIQFQLLSATIYYGPQSDIRVKSYAHNFCYGCLFEAHYISKLYKILDG